MKSTMVTNDHCSSDALFTADIQPFVVAVSDKTCMKIKTSNFLNMTTSYGSLVPVGQIHISKSFRVVAIMQVHAWKPRQFSTSNAHCNTCKKLTLAGSVIPLCKVVQ